MRKIQKHKWALGANARCCGVLVALGLVSGACASEQPSSQQPAAAVTNAGGQVADPFSVGQGAAGDMASPAATAPQPGLNPATGPGGPVAGPGAATDTAVPALDTTQVGTEGGATDTPAPDGTAPAGPTVPAADASPDWTLMGYDVGSTYHNPAETTITKDNAATLVQAWRTDMGDNVYGAPLQVGDTIYASTGRVVRAFEAATGDEIWRNTRVGTTASLAFDNGMLFSHRASSEMVALDAMTGEQKWAESAGPSRGDGSSSPIVAGDIVFVGGSNGGAEVAGIGGPFRGWISGLDKNSGKSVFSFYTVPAGASGASLWSTVAVDLNEGVVYGDTGNNHGGQVTDTSDAIVAVNIADQQLKWKNQRTMGDNWSVGSSAPDADFGANPILYTAMVDGSATSMVAAGQKAGAIHGIRREDGMLVWTRSLCEGSRDGSSGIFVNGAWSGKHLLFACNGSTTKLFGVDGATGDVLFEESLPGLVWGRISTVPGVGFVGAGKELVIFDSDTGKTLKSVPGEGGSVTGTITVAHGRVAYGEGMSWSSASPGSTLTVLTLP